MIRQFGRMIAFAMILAAPLGSASAQWGFPGGYGGWGWGGWGASTPIGDMAMGMGMFAAGMGTYNVNNAVATSINNETFQRYNEYLWQSQQLANQRYRQSLEERRVENIANRKAIRDRKRNNPEQSDINSGDALNICLDEITNPKIYLPALKSSNLKIPGRQIRSIPFLYASAALTVSVDELLSQKPPPELTNAVFEDDFTELRRLKDELKKQEAEQQQFNPDTVTKFQDQLKLMWKDVEKTYQRGSREFRLSQRYIKGLLGLSEMMNTPAMDVILADVDKRPEATIGELISFMKAFNLRFGAANTNSQRQVYNGLYPLLVRLRNEASPVDAGYAEVKPSTDRLNRPGDFFAGMDFEHFDAKKVHDKPPAPPAPK